MKYISIIIVFIMSLTGFAKSHKDISSKLKRFSAKLCKHLEKHDANPVESFQECKKLLIEEAKYSGCKEDVYYWRKRCLKLKDVSEVRKCYTSSRFFIPAICNKILMVDYMYSMNPVDAELFLKYRPVIITAHVEQIRQYKKTDIFLRLSGVLKFHAHIDPNHKKSMREAIRLKKDDKVKLNCTVVGRVPKTGKIQGVSFTACKILD